MYGTREPGEHGLRARVATGHRKAGIRELAEHARRRLGKLRDPLALDPGAKEQHVTRPGWVAAKFRPPLKEAGVDAVRHARDAGFGHAQIAEELRVLAVQADHLMGASEREVGLPHDAERRKPLLERHTRAPAGAVVQF